MSGICGIVYFNGQRVENELDTMCNTLKHRGIDGISKFQKDHVGIAYLHLEVRQTTSQQPFLTKSGAMLVADARIDDPQVTAEKDDIATIAEVYEKHQNDLVQHLTGDFAIAIWNEKTKKLLLARDHCAARPLYFYHKPNVCVAFASEMKALLALPMISAEINTQKVLRYMEWGSYLRPYRDETFYKNIKSVPPAHAYEIDNETIMPHFGWKIDSQKFAHLQTDNDYLIAFRETFFEAVKCRLRTHFPISSHLSGGLDSSAVAVVAKTFTDKTIHTLHIDAGPTADEKHYAEAVLAEGGFEHEYVFPLPDLMASLNQMTYVLDRPDLFTLLPIHHLSVAEAVKKRGSRILLTGHDGDSVVGYGRGYVRTLFREKNWSELKPLLENYAKVADFENAETDWSNWSLEKRYQYFLRMYLKYELKSVLKQKRLDKAVVLWWNYTTKLDLNSFDFIGNLWKLLSGKTSLKTPNWPFSEENDYPFQKEMLDYMSDVWHEGMLEGTEEHEHIAAHYEHEMAHPFYDRRLIELCAVIPEKLKFGNGYRRGPLRESVKNLLPEIVRLRTSKVKFDGTIGDAMRENSTVLTVLLEKAKQKLAQNEAGFTQKEKEYLEKRLDLAVTQLHDPNSKPFHYMRVFHWAGWA